MLRIAGIVGLQIKAIRNYNYGMDYAELHDKSYYKSKKHTVKDLVSRIAKLKLLVVAT